MCGAGRDFGVDLDGINDGMKIDNANPAGADFTIEMWLKHTTGRTVVDTIVSCGSNGLALGFTADGKFFFTFGTGTAAETLTTPTPSTDGAWHHWAVTFDHAAKTQVVYRDGREEARRTARSVPATATFLIVGCADIAPFTFFPGALAELRTWSTVRTEAEIGALMRNRVDGTETDLAGAWTYDHDSLNTTPGDGSGQDLYTDSSPAQHTGGLWGKPGTCVSPATRYQVSAAVGDRVRVSSEDFRYGQWDHVAAVLEQSWALRFNGAAWAQTPDADQLDIVGDLTIEVFAQLDPVATRQGLISKGQLADGAGGTVPYQLSVLAGGKLEFAFEEPGPVVKRFTSSTAIGTGPCRIAVVRRAGSTTQEVKGKRKYPITNAQGTTTEQEFDVVERVDVEQWQDITFVVDGADYGTTRYTGPGPRGNDGPLEIGRAQDGTSRYHLTGVIGEVRIWAKAREKDQLGTAVERRDDGLAARWTFEENTGNITADTAGGFDLKLRGARWTADPDPTASSLTLYRNGHPIPATTPTTNSLTTWGSEQLTLGALDNAGTFGEFYTGTLEEVRLWRTARTDEQVLDNLFTRLKGDKQDLLAYWPRWPRPRRENHQHGQNHLARRPSPSRPHDAFSGQLHSTTPQHHPGVDTQGPGEHIERGALRAAVAVCWGDWARAVDQRRAVPRRPPAAAEDCAGDRWAVVRRHPGPPTATGSAGGHGHADEPAAGRGQLRGRTRSVSRPVRRWSVKAASASQSVATNCCSSPTST
ncbi:LamG domain-containing protein [Streptomyces sp. NPDC002490]|uniref:LamG domain-containing protein n=1 Tax=Streptomyces sp. NPDC002490 TaxID=3154416 RepID=UPI003316ADDC